MEQHNLWFAAEVVLPVLHAVELADAHNQTTHAIVKPNLGTRRDLLSEIHPSSEPSRGHAATLSVGSGRTVQWVCRFGHCWAATIRSRAESGTGCPYCGNRKILAGFNDFATLHPEIVTEWHPTRNGNIQPTEIGAGSPSKRWWLGVCGHSWDAEVRSRVRGFGCPYCDGKRVDESNSFAATYPEYLSWWGEENVGDVRRPENVHRTAKCFVTFVCPETHRFNMSVEKFVRRREKCPVCCGDLVLTGINSLADTHPMMVLEWDPTKNSSSPHSVHWRSVKPQHWLCSFNHSYQRSPRVRIENNNGCPFCSGHQILAGFNDFATLHPEIVTEWHPTRNGNIQPTEIGAGSPSKRWWLGVCGHSWDAEVRSRVRGFGCPYCDGKRCTVGVDDLATTRPDLAKQWHPSKNGTLRQTDVKQSSGRSVWWFAKPCLHEWEGTIRNRTTDNCAVCRNIVVVPGVNDVSTLKPQTVPYFNAKLNPGVSFDDYGPGSSARLHWECPQGHTWGSQIRDVVKQLNDEQGSPCPYCSGKKVCPGVNDVHALRPDLVQQLDRRIHTEDALVGVSFGSGLRFAWTCLVKKDHNWTARLVDRIHHNTGCPGCVAETWSSDGEDEVADFVVSLGMTVRRSVRIDLNQRRNSFDICIDSHKIIIEYNGLYYHCEEMGRDSKYHAAKLAAAENAGYTLLTVWEDDWRDRRTVVKRMIAHKLEVSSQLRIAARKTVVVPVPSKDATEFLNINHIQGAMSGSLRFGLQFQGKLVALLVVRCEGRQANIVRYATSAIVSGGFGKLLRTLERSLKENNPEIVEIKTFSDNLVSNGDLYRKLGFRHDDDIDPDYCYFKGGSKRMHKFNYRIQRFRNDPDLVYVENMSESELAALNGLRRIWDAGKKRWIKALD